MTSESDHLNPADTAVVKFIDSWSNADLLAQVAGVLTCTEANRLAAVLRLRDASRNLVFEFLDAWIDHEISTLRAEWYTYAIHDCQIEISSTPPAPPAHRLERGTPTAVLNGRRDFDHGFNDFND